MSLQTAVVQSVIEYLRCINRFSYWPVPLHADVLTRHARGQRHVEGEVSATLRAQVGVTLAHPQVARALLSVALRLAAAPGETVLT